MQILVANKAISSQATDVKNLILNSYGCPQNTYICKAINDNLGRDRNKCLVSPRSIASLNHYWEQNLADSQISVSDQLRYFGPVSGKYFYQLNKDSKQRISITVPIHFENIKDYSNSEIRSYGKKIKAASSLWNKHNPYSKLISFNFKLSQVNESRSVSPRLIRQYTRGPYFDRWSFDWDQYIIAHEFGHLMGLFDEYDYFKPQESLCDSKSLMCSSNYGVPQAYHYHLILQRTFCEI